jgi:hypothetical protein
MVGFVAAACGQGEGLVLAADAVEQLGLIEEMVGDDIRYRRRSCSRRSAPLPAED